jgi:hypothetical protein
VGSSGAEHQVQVCEVPEDLAHGFHHMVEHNTEAFAGLHNKGKRIILIFDEASAIADKVWEVAEGAMTDEDTEIIWLAFGNPTQNTGRFRECFGKYAPLEALSDRFPHGRRHQQRSDSESGLRIMAKIPTLFECVCAESFPEPVVISSSPRMWLLLQESIVLRDLRAYPRLDHATLHALEMTRPS